MSVITQTFLNRCARSGIFVNDNLRGSITTSSFFQFNIVRIVGAACRFTNPSNAQNVVMLPSIGLGEAPTAIFLINDGAGTVFVYPYLDPSGNSDTINAAGSAVGAATARVLVAAGNVGTFIPEGSPSGRGGLPSIAGSVVWPGNLSNWSGSITA